MQAELKSYYCSEVEDLDGFVPADENSFCLSLRLMVGPKGEEGAESFDLEVCTPTWLQNTFEPNEIIIGRHLLIVFRFDLRRIIQRIRSFVDSCSGNDWDEVAIKVGRLAFWEFEDYRP